MTIEAAAAMGFKREEAEPAIAMLEVLGRQDDLDLAMDLARFVRITLPDAVRALAIPGGLRRLGFAPDTDIRAEVAGQAAAYAKTFYGLLDVREAHGHTFSRAFTDVIERWFGPR